MWFGIRGMRRIRRMYKFNTFVQKCEIDGFIWSGRFGCFINWTEKEPSTLTVLHHVQVEQKISQAIRQRQRRKEGQTCVGLCHRFAWRQRPLVQFACKFYHNSNLRGIPDVNTSSWMFVERCFDLLLKWFVLIYDFNADHAQFPSIIKFHSFFMHGLVWKRMF